MRSAQAMEPDFSAVRGKRILIALSGGPDSVALAVMLAQAREAYALTLCAAHVDHCIRPESAEDAGFCRALCQGLDIPFHCVRVDVPAAARHGGGLETLARRLRYERLEALRRQTGADVIALAHHMDDQAETVLMHLARGAGSDGLCGMPLYRAEDRIYRPLLGYRKSELEAYLIQRGFGWREDATNRVADNPRNALRLNVIPEIERWYPGFVRSVSRCAETVRIECDLLDALTGDFMSRGGSCGSFCTWLELDPLPHRAILRRAIRKRCGETLSSDQVNALEALCAQKRGRIDIGPGSFAERTGSRLYFVPKQLPSVVTSPLAADGETHLSPIGRLLATPCAPMPIRGDPMRQVLNAEALAGAVLRTRRPGDRIRPLGGGDKLLSDYFIDRKVDRPLRDFTPLVAVGDRIHWVIGQGISQEAAVGRGNAALQLEFKYDI
ncbi:MAG: tRNA lysidine(34) synthetase TilS [Clostridia bacterium]|nr:tRNA lysidine(34) synthetase TilS [Clostridia bacterium]